MKQYRITANGQEYDGVEFEVEDDATEEDVAQAAFDVVSEYLSYGWEPVGH